MKFTTPCISGKRQIDNIMILFFLDLFYLYLKHI